MSSSKNVPYDIAKEHVANKIRHRYPSDKDLTSDELVSKYSLKQWIECVQYDGLEGEISGIGWQGVCSSEQVRQTDSLKTHANTWREGCHAA